MVVRGTAVRDTAVRYVDVMGTAAWDEGILGKWVDCLGACRTGGDGVRDEGVAAAWHTVSSSLQSSTSPSALGL